MRALLLILLSFIGMADARPKLDIRGTFGSTELGDDGLTTHTTYAGPSASASSRRPNICINRISTKMLHWWRTRRSISEKVRLE
jgi:hypothetical protein